MAIHRDSGLLTVRHAHPGTTRRDSADGTRWFSVTTLLDRPTNTDALETVAAQVSEDACLVVAFIAPDLIAARPDRGAAAAIHRGCGDVAFIGGTSSGIVDASGQFGAAIQLIAIGGTGFRSTTGLARYTPDGCRTAGAAVGQAAALDERLANNALLLLCDGLQGDVADVLRGAYRVSGADIPIVGGCAGDDLTMQETTQLCGGEVMNGGVAGASLSSTGPIGIGVDHGWDPVGEPMVVTRSVGTSVLTLDDRPAMDMYLEVVGASGEIGDSASFARYAQTRPLGLCDEESGQVRFVTGGNVSERSLDFLVHLPEGQLVWVMRGDRASVVQATTTAASQAIDQLGGREPLGVIAFDCVARRSVIGDDSVADEIHALETALPPGTPFGGFYSYGEIARTGGSLGLHHQTMVVLAVA